MTDTPSYREIGVSRDGYVATVEMRRPPHNFFDSALVAEIGDAFEQLDADPEIRAIVFAAEGRSFCAGADFSKRMDTGTVSEGTRSAAGRHLYKEAIRLFRTRKPIVGAVHGAAVGGGLGLALVPDFRVTCQEARFSANFNRLGFHPGFGLTATLPRLVGAQQAALLFYTGRRIPGDEAVRIGLADLLVPQAEVRSAAQALGARNRAIGAARRHVDARNGAPRADRCDRGRHRARAGRAGLAAPHRGLRRGHQGDGRPPPPRFPRPLIAGIRTDGAAPLQRGASSAAGRDAPAPGRTDRTRRA